MQIVIDIGEHNKNVIDRFVNGEGFEVLPTPIVDAVIRAVRNGKSLPKGHGDLKDVDNLKHAFAVLSVAVQGNFSDADIASIIYNSPTIIKADKEGKDADSN